MKEGHTTRTADKGDNMKLSDLIAVAIGKGIKEVKASSDALTVGTHEVDAIVHIKGTLTKGEDYEQKIRHKAQPEAILAVALSKLNGVTIESIVKEAMDVDPDRITVIKKEASDAIEKLKEAKGKTPCSGKVTTKLDFTEVTGKVEASAVEAEIALETEKA